MTLQNESNSEPMGSGMTGQDANEPIDFVLLDEAAKKLLGYYVYRKFRAYLASITATLHQQYQDGLSEGLTRPTARGRAMLFDFRALGYDVLIEIIGVYMYVLSCHKNANWRLLQRYEAKQVLYLRGYDFEAAFLISGGIAAGLSTMDTEGFTLKLPSLLQRRLFKVLSPKEVDWETVTAERYYDDLDALIQWVNRRPAAVYLNALSWKQGVLELIPRMDHYIVYVSSLTESALWELDQLNTDQRRGRVTVVFDEDAIAKKESQLATQADLVGRLGKAIWTKQGGPPSLTAAQVRDGLAEVFTVMQSAYYHYSPIGERAGELSEENRTLLLQMLNNHGGFAEYAGRRLLAYGCSHEFMDQSEQANASWDAIFNATRGSVDKVFTGCQKSPE